MKRISYYIAALVVAGGVIVGGWAWQKYFSVTPTRLLTFSVERGDLRDLVKARGDVRPAKEINLEFPFSGIVRRIYAVEGQNVFAGEALMSLDMNDLAIDLRRLQAVLVQRQSNLQKLIAGPTLEDIVVLETKLQNAAVASADAKRNLSDKLYDAYTKSDDAVRNNIDQFFSNPRSSTPELNNITVSDAVLKMSLEADRPVIEATLTGWQTAFVSGATTDDIETRISDSVRRVARVQAFLDRMALAVNALTPTATLSRTVVDGYRAAVATARTNVNTATVNLTAAAEKWRAAASAEELAARELALKKSGTRVEDVAIARGQVAEAEENIAAAQDKIRKGMLRAPVDAKVLDITVEEGEFFAGGFGAIALASAANEIQTDISELDIGRVAVGLDVEFTLDAFPSGRFSGSVTSIDEQPVVKDGDTYYRVHIAVREATSEVRIGMKADVAIIVAEKTGALKIPRVVLTDNEGEKSVMLKESGGLREVEIETGITDGELVEVVSGLIEGQIVVVVGQ